MAKTYITDMNNIDGVVTIYRVTYLVNGKDKADGILGNAYDDSRAVAYEDSIWELHFGYYTEFWGEPEDYITECFSKALGDEFDKANLIIDSDEIVFSHITIAQPTVPSCMTRQNWTEARVNILCPEQMAMAYFAIDSGEGNDDLEEWLLAEGKLANPDDCEDGSYTWDDFFDGVYDWMDAHRH